MNLRFCYHWYWYISPSPPPLPPSPAVCFPGGHFVVGVCKSLHSPSNFFIFKIVDRSILFFFTLGRLNKFFFFIFQSHLIRFMFTFEICLNFRVLKKVNSFFLWSSLTFSFRHCSFPLLTWLATVFDHLAKLISLDQFPIFLFTQPCFALYSRFLISIVLNFNFLSYTHTHTKTTNFLVNRPSCHRFFDVYLGIDFEQRRPFWCFTNAWLDVCAFLIYLSPVGRSKTGSILKIWTKWSCLIFPKILFLIL